MKVLMFGWEFPPHISGGLGTACYGITRGLATIPDLDVLFVVPKAFGDEDKSKVEDIIGANDVSIINKHIRHTKYSKQFDYIETYEGRPFAVPGVKARYVRLWSNGNTSDDMNHYIEVEVFGK